MSTLIHFGALLLATILLVEFWSIVNGGSINVNIPQERARLQRRRQTVQQQIVADRRQISESQGEARRLAQQSLRLHQQQLQQINRELRRLDELEDADNGNAGQFPGK